MKFTVKKHIENHGAVGMTANRRKAYIKKHNRRPNYFYRIEKVVQGYRFGGEDYYTCTLRGKEKIFIYRPGDYKIHNSYSSNAPKNISSDAQKLFAVAHEEFVRETKAALGGASGYIVAPMPAATVACRHFGKDVYEFVVASGDDIFRMRCTPYEFLQYFVRIYERNKEKEKRENLKSIDDEIDASIRRGDLPLLIEAEKSGDRYLACALRDWVGVITKDEAEFLKSVDEACRFVAHDGAYGNDELKIGAVTKGIRTYFNRILCYVIGMKIDGVGRVAVWYPDRRELNIESEAPDLERFYCRNGCSNELVVRSYPKNKTILIKDEVKDILIESARILLGGGK